MAIILAISAPSVGLAQSSDMFKTKPKNLPDVVKPEEKPYQEALPDNKILIKTTISSHEAQWQGEYCGTARILVVLEDNGSIPYSNGTFLVDGKVSYGNKTTTFNWVYLAHQTNEKGEKTVTFRGTFYIDDPYRAKELTLN